jgi:hypothetical protein
MQIFILVDWSASYGDHSLRLIKVRLCVRHLVDIIMVNKWISCMQASYVLSVCEVMFQTPRYSLWSTFQTPSLSSLLLNPSTR